MRFLVRLRPFAALSVAAVAAVLLAGCAGGGEDSATPSATGGVAGDLCSAAAPSGDISDGISASGDIGSVPTLDFAKPIDIDGLTIERTVMVEGDGEPLVAGDFVNYAATIVDGVTGDVLSQTGYTAGEVLPEQVSPESGGQIFGCATVGSRLALAAATSDEANPSLLYVIDVLGVTPTAAWGEAQDPVAGLPTVTLDESGAPTITIPDAEPLAQTTVVDLKKGDGATVAPGDQVLLQYRGVRWSNGEEFDSTWSKGGVPIPLGTTQVVDGFRQALEGQTVGSQVLVSMTPADGYGEGEINTTDLKGDTLVFVVDILGTATPAPAAAQ
ncbi:FKBP-type peptidyl-prolyl cis-trans isomerase [Microbacterium memoriense]|uniref:peptidylprolyl isomerase n=1 Tax=Microbacterium memoriense TaxID=2978350 RepID=A0ABT2PC64_9MICO|nr:FKBP-type peptidyl-prolyl cis-trans isomerase [Microbacterium memoriense]MCT9002020.1 FKBP-type peptidyl-prolyl cis-trans isomerase [Microbacterium memoriense]